MRINHDILNTRYWVPHGINFYAGFLVLKSFFLITVTRKLEWKNFSLNHWCNNVNRYSSLITKAVVKFRKVRYCMAVSFSSSLCFPLCQNILYLVQVKSLHQNFSTCKKSIKSHVERQVKSRRILFLNLVFFSRYLHKKETVLKQNNAIFSEPQTLWSSLSSFWKLSLRSSSLNLETISLKSETMLGTFKNLRAVEFEGNFSGFWKKCWTKLSKTWLRLLKKALINI